MFAGVTNRGRGANEGWASAVKGCDAFETRDDVRHVGAKNAAIGMHFVEHDVAQPLKKSGPLRVVRKNARMHHVGVAENDAPLLAGFLSRVSWRIAVKDDGGHGNAAVFDHRVQPVLLVPRQCLGRIKEERGGARILGESLEHGQVETEALAACRRRRDDHILATARGSDGLYLMTVELLDAARMQGADESGMEIGHAAVVGMRWRDQPFGGEARPNTPFGDPLLGHRGDTARLFPRWSRHAESLMGTLRMYSGLRRNSGYRLAL